MSVEEYDFQTITRNIPEEKRINNLLSAADILSMQLPDPVWIVPDYLPVGMSILAARPKIGKSWLALQICQAIVSGGKLFGQDIEQGRVLYLALEDSVRRLQSRMIKQGWGSENSHLANLFTFEEFRKHIGFLNREGTARLEALILANDYRFVVIDTLSRAFIGVKDINDSQEVTSALHPLQEIAIHNNIGIMLIDHHTKSRSFNPDPIDDVLGSTAKSAVSDTIFGIYTENGKQGAVLKARGKDIEEIDKRILFDHLTGCWQVVGDNKELEATDKENEIIAALKELGNSKAAHVASYLGKNRGNTATALENLVRKQLVYYVTVEGTRYYGIKEN